jgi:hypothetical protein
VNLPAQQTGADRPLPIELAGGLAPTRAVLARMRRRLGEVVRSGSRQTIERSIASYSGLVRFGAFGRQVVTCQVTK